MPPKNKKLPGGLNIEGVAFNDRKTGHFNDIGMLKDLKVCQKNTQAGHFKDLRSAERCRQNLPRKTITADAADAASSPPGLNSSGKVTNFGTTVWPHSTCTRTGGDPTHKW